MQKTTDVMKGECLIVEDTEIMGIVDGFGRVERTRLVVKEIITRNLTVHSGSIVELRGMVNGDVTNEGGTLHVTGMIDGALKRVPGSTTVEPGAVIQGRTI